MDHTRFEELKEAYVLKALPEREQQAFEAYLAAHPERRAEVNELSSVANLLALACEEHEPSPELRRNLLDQIESEARPSQEYRTSWWARFREALSWRQLSLGAAALTLAGLLIWNISLQSDLQNQQTYELRASGPAEGATGEVIYLKN